MSDIYKSQVEAVEKFEASIGLQKGFFRALWKEDDWSFVIKSHALIESAITYVLSTVLKENGLDQFIQTLDLSGGRNSKIVLARMLELLDEDEIRFIKGLSTIRNRLVHNIRHVGFSLGKYVKDLDRSKAEEFLNTVGIIYYDPEAAKSEKKQVADGIFAKPKLYIWHSVLNVVASAALRAENARLERENAQMKRQTLEMEIEHARTILKHMQPTKPCEKGKAAGQFFVSEGQ